MITLTVAEIMDLAVFAGLTLNSRFNPTGDDLETEIDIQAAHPDGALDEDTGKRTKTRFVAVMTDYPEEGCMPLGPELPIAPVTREHEASAACWCGPEIDYVDPDTGATVYVHKQAQ